MRKPRRSPRCRRLRAWYGRVMERVFSATSFAAGIVAGALLSAGWFLGIVHLPLASPASAPEATTTALAQESSGAIAVSDQSAGGDVLIESVTVPPPGVWVAVRDALEGGELGNVLGALRVGGPRTAVRIPLLRGTDPGRRYVVELYRDDADGGFDPARNSVYVDFSTGARVVEYFSTTAP